MAHSKKSHTASAKLAAGKKQAHFGATSDRHSAEKVVRLGSDTMKTLFTGSADEAHKAQEKLFSISRDGVEKLTKSADATSKVMYEAIAASRDNIETAIECGNVTASFAKELTSEVFEGANQAFSDSVETTKEIFACRTINDMMELNSKLLRDASEQFFARSHKISNMVFEYANEAMEPVNERISHANTQLHKALNS